ncbi:hypothetical protein BJ878DRAFT_54873 [Calycina marina]|uniref:Uncharacterized protein n=1 Tax=Calycina marina TaxID=1763456 RepID=A0A9P8CIF7_9HELO|nr:hypothetical protein BJ878DRAFT_54873 [Calycina marina]
MWNDHPPDLEVEISVPPMIIDESGKDHVMEDNKAPEEDSNSTIEVREVEDGDDLMKVGEVERIVGENVTALPGDGLNSAKESISADNTVITNGTTQASETHPAINRKINGISHSDDPKDPHVSELNGQSRSTPGGSTTSRISSKLSKRKNPPPSFEVTEEVARVTAVYSTISPDAAQRFFRAQWRAVLFEPFDEDYLTFMLRAGLKNSTERVVERLLKDSGIFKESVIAAAAKRPEVRHIVMSNALLEELPRAALDKALEKRIKDVPAPILLKWLSQASRLGYTPDDVIEIESESESVTPVVGPTIAAMSQADKISSQAQRIHKEQKVEQLKQRYAADGASRTSDSLLEEQERNYEAQRLTGTASVVKTRKPYTFANKTQKPLPDVGASVQPVNGIYICPYCSRAIRSLSGYNFHVSKKVCTQELPYGKFFSDYCDNCQKGFVGKQGLLYHTKKNVCRAEENETPSGPMYIAPAPGMTALFTSSATTTGFSVTPVQTQSPAPAPASAFVPVSASTSTPVLAYRESQSPTDQLKQEAADKTPTIPLSTGSGLGVFSFSQKPVPQVTDRPHMPRTSSGFSSGTPFQTPEAPIAIPTRIPKSTVLSAGDTPGRFFGPGQLALDKREEMDARLEAADQKFFENLAALPDTLIDESRGKKIASMKQGLASKKSMIRKEYGVTVRQKKRARPDDANLTTSSTPANKALKVDHSRGPSSAPQASKRRQTPAEPEASSLHRSSPTVPIVHGFSPINVSQPPTAPPGYMTIVHLPGENFYGMAGSSHPESGYYNGEVSMRRRKEGSERDSPLASACSSSGLDMVEVRSEDDASSMVAQKQAKAAKKIVIDKGTQARWEALQGKQKTNGQTAASSSKLSFHADSAENDHSMADAPARISTTVIDMSSDNEDGGALVDTSGIAAHDEVLPSVESVDDDSDLTSLAEPEHEHEHEAGDESTVEVEVEPKIEPVATRGLRAKRGVKA